MKKLLLNATFVALALGSHGYAMQPGQDLTSKSKVSAPSRLKPALMAAGLTAAPLAMLGLWASQASISDIMFPADAEHQSTACWFGCDDATARVNNIYRAQQYLFGALAAGLVAGGATYANVKGKVGACFKKIASLFKSKNLELAHQDLEDPAAIAELLNAEAAVRDSVNSMPQNLDRAATVNAQSPSQFPLESFLNNSPQQQQQQPPTTVNTEQPNRNLKISQQPEDPAAPNASSIGQLTQEELLAWADSTVNKQSAATEPQATQQQSDRTLDDFFANCKAFETQAVPDSASRQAIQAHVQQAVKAADKIFDEMLNQKVRERLQQKRTIEAQLLRPNLIDKAIIQAQHDAVRAQNPNAYAIVPATAPTVVETAPVAQAPAPVSSVTAATTSSQPAVQPAVAVPASQVEAPAIKAAAAKPVIEEEAKQREPEGQKVVSLDKIEKKQCKKFHNYQKLSSKF